MFEGGLRGWKLLIAVAAGIVAVAGAVKVVTGLWSNPEATANLTRADVGSTMTWDRFKVHLLNARGPDFSPASVPSVGADASVVLLAQVSTAEPTPTDTTPTDTTPTNTTPTNTTPTDTTPTDTTPTDTTPTDTTPQPALQEAPIDPTAGDEPADEPVPLPPAQRKTITDLSRHVRGKAKLPHGCEHSVTARSCPAAVYMGAMPGPPGTPQGALDRYPFVDQKETLSYLLRTLPLVRHKMRQHRRVPVGVEVFVHLKLTGDTDHRFYLKWSIYAKGPIEGSLLSWEQNRTAEIIKPTRSPYLSHFWLPIPVARHGYTVHLQVVDADAPQTPLDALDGKPGFR